MPRDSIAATFLASVASDGMPAMIDHSRGSPGTGQVRAAGDQERFADPKKMFKPVQSIRSSFRTVSTELSQGIPLHAT